MKMMWMSGCSGHLKLYLLHLIECWHKTLLQVLELMKEVKEEEEEEEEEEVEEENSDISGYHSDSDSTVMMSGNSPFISKTARYNFLSRSGNVW